MEPVDRVSFLSSALSEKRNPMACTPFNHTNVSDTKNIDYSHILHLTPILQECGSE